MRFLLTERPITFDTEPEEPKEADWSIFRIGGRLTLTNLPDSMPEQDIRNRFSIIIRTIRDSIHKTFVEANYYCDLIGWDYAGHTIYLSNNIKECDIDFTLTIKKEGPQAEKYFTTEDVDEFWNRLEGDYLGSSQGCVSKYVFPSKIGNWWPYILTLACECFESYKSLPGKSNLYDYNFSSFTLYTKEIKE